MVATMARRRFTVEEFHRMFESGILTEDERVELLGGEVVQMAPFGSGHAAALTHLHRVFGERVGDQAVVRVGMPLQLSPHSEARPDIVLLRPQPDLAAGSHPGADDVLLIVEVADGTFAYDREVKLPHYAGAGIKEAWIADVMTQRVFVYRVPAAGGYQRVARAERGIALTVLALPGLEFPVETLLA